MAFYKCSTGRATIKPIKLRAFVQCTNEWAFLIKTFGTIYTHAEPNGIFVRVESRVVVACVCEYWRCRRQVQGRLQMECLFVVSTRVTMCDSHYFVLNSTHKNRMQLIKLQNSVFFISVAWMSLEQKRFELLLIHIRRTVLACSPYIPFVYRQSTPKHFSFCVLSHFHYLPFAASTYACLLLNEWNGRREAIMHAINCVRRNRRAQYCTTATVLRHKKTSNNIKIAMLHSVFLSIYHARRSRRKKIIIIVVQIIYIGLRWTVGTASKRRHTVKVHS